MTSLNDILDQSLASRTKFNWPWFVELCVCAIITLFFLFYFNRLFATLISYGIRAYAWHHYRVWVDIQALQISLLGGRIFFKGIRYHGENETIVVQTGYMTWRYWFRNVRHVDLAANKKLQNDKRNTLNSDGQSRSSSPVSSGLGEDHEGVVNKADSEARIAIFVTGVEWFVYNRTPLYDAILRDEEGAEIVREAQSGSAADTTSSDAVRVHLRSKLRRRPKSNETSSSEEAKLHAIGSEGIAYSDDKAPPSTDRRSSIETNPDSTEADVTTIQSLLVQLLPIYLECTRAAVSIGNEHTRAILVATVDKAKGHVDARGCGPHDLFQQVFDFEIEHPIVQMRPNPDFIGSQLSVAEHIIVASDPLETRRRWWQWNLNLARRKHNALHALRNIVPGLQSSVESLHHGKMHNKVKASHVSYVEPDSSNGEWHGLSRYLDENDEDDHHAWNHIDYARFSTILDCPSVHLTFYWDSPGYVKAKHFDVGQDAVPKDINGVDAPAYGLDLTIRGGDINYGPWADRLRAEIQSVFLPASYRSSTPAKTLKVGQWRQSTNMIIRVDIEEEVTMRVPTRESSKDWRWRGRATAVRDAAGIRKQRQKRHFRLRRGTKPLLGPDVRSFGWISFSVSSDSSVHYAMDMVASPSGYRNQLRLDLKRTKATSSVNHGDLWRCENQTLQCDLSNPLAWNGQHTWHFDIRNQSMEMFLLRDHMFLLTDLITDFTAGQKGNYMTFVPFEYKIKLEFSDLKLFLNANDFNIIDNPCDFDSNAFLVLGMRQLGGNVSIPMNYYSPSQNSVLFQAQGEDVSLDLKTPVWNTLRAFASDENMATLKKLELDGSYNYCSDTSPHSSDSLFMNIIGISPKFHLQGYLIRYFMNVKENYFGEDLHFRTLEEYRNQLRPDNLLAAEDQRRAVKKANDLDVILNIRAEDSCALMPANLYLREENLRIDIMLVEADMRFTNYYMDLQVNSSPVEVSVEKESVQQGQLRKERTACQLHISAVSVYGHRLFGAPPTEPTYVCNWDFDVGSIYGECSTDFLRVTIAAIQAFIFTMDDYENALPVTRTTILNDITFLRARVSGVCIWIVTDISAFLLQTGNMTVSFNDWAGQHFSKSLKADVPAITLASTEAPGSSRRQTKSRQELPTLACIQTSLYVVNIDKKAEFEHQRQLQQYHVKFHDLRTRRAAFLLHDQKPVNAPAKIVQWSQDLPTMPVPDLPEPLAQATKRSHIRTRDKVGRSRGRQGSFLSSESLSLYNGQLSTTEKQFQASRTGSSGPSRAVEAAPDLHKNSSERLFAFGKVGKSAPKDAPFSSPWIEPYFSLKDAQLDLSYMPSVGSALARSRLKASGDPGADQDYTDVDEPIPHAAVFCTFPDGVRGFCSPLLFPSIVDLLRSISPHDPHSILDAIQEATTTGIRNLTTERQGEKLDFAIRLPVAAIRLVHAGQTSKSQLDADSFMDQYDIVISQAQLRGRVAPTVTRQAHGHTKENVVLLQASIRDVDIQVAENFKPDQKDGAKLSVSIHDIELWLSLQDKTRVELQIGLLNTLTGGSTVDRMSMLVERSRMMIMNGVKEFESLDRTSATQHLIYHLSLMDTQMAEPIFLSKPSYVLRSAAGHIRLSESWKVAVLFRQRLLCQPPEVVQDLIEHTSCLFENEHDRAQQQILESIDNSSTWHQDREACKPILAAIFGQSSDIANKIDAPKDLEIGVYLDQLSIILDPGPQQSEFVLQGGNLSFAQKPVIKEDSEGGRTYFAREPQMRVQLWFADITLDFNWKLIELAKSLIKQINLSSTSPDGPSDIPRPTSKSSTNELDLMIVAGTDVATAKIRTINLSLYMAASNLTTSVVVQMSDVDATTSVLLASTTAQLKLASQYRKLFGCKLQTPSVYGLYRQHRRRLDSADTVRFAASCDVLRFDMKEDALSVLEVVDSVIRDEAMIIQELINSIEQKTKPPRSEPKTALKLEDVHMTFFLNDYKLQLRPLPSLFYSITGSVARTSFVPLQLSKFAIHIDVKKSNHTLLDPNNDNRVSDATFEIPPVSGRVVIGVTKQRITVHAGSTVERIVIEAKAVQACIEAAYRPQNVRRLKDSTAVLGRIQDSIAHMNRSSSPKEPVPRQEGGSDRIVLYSAIAILEGLEIHCGAPAANNQDYRADLKVGFHSTSFRIRNHRKVRKAYEAQVTPLNKPQVEVNFHKTFMDLRRRAQETTYSYAKFGMGFKLTSVTHIGPKGAQIQHFRVQSEGTQLDLHPESVSLVMDMAIFLQSRIKAMVSVEEHQMMSPLRRLTLINSETGAVPRTDNSECATPAALSLLDKAFSLDLRAIRLRWIVANDPHTSSGRRPEDLVFSIRQIDLYAERGSSARLTILDTQLQTVPKTQSDPVQRTANSALLPEMIFNAAHFSTKKDRRFAFQAAGKALDLRLAADGMLPLSTIQRSLARAAADLRGAQIVQTSSDEPTNNPITTFMGNKRLVSLLVDADFAGAVVKITPRVQRDEDSRASAFGLLKGPKRSRAGRYAQAIQSDDAEEAVLRAPGIAVKVEYLDANNTGPSLSTELKVAASSNTLAPSVVPLILEIYSSIKEIMGDDNKEGEKAESRPAAPKSLTATASPDTGTKSEPAAATDPTAILGRVRLNAGIWVQKQEFCLTCQPIARVAATAMFDEIFVTINTVQEEDHERFFSIVTSFNKLRASVQHVYSRESTASFEVDSIVVSLMNSKHVSAKNGISAIVNVCPMRATLNAKQMQDFLLFREIWYPVELRQPIKVPTSVPESTESQGYAMQKYHELASTAALPWHAVVSMHELKLLIDFGPSLGKSSFMITKLWASSRKQSDLEQNLCVGFNRVGIDSSGRMSGFIELEDFRARTSIRWPAAKDLSVRAPLVQASIGFGHLRLKTAFDYQPFAVADVSSFNFLMYNIRPARPGESDRLVSILDGGKIQVFCVSTAAAQILSIVQAFERLFQEKREAFQDSLRELDQLLRRKSVFPTAVASTDSAVQPTDTTKDSPPGRHRLHTDVVVTLKAIDIGAFPSTFFDTQILKIEAVDVQTRFAVSTIETKTRSGLSMALGQVRVALSTVNRANTKALGEVEIGDVIDRATSSRGGTILKVPRLVAAMQTWQQIDTNTVEYIFRSTFQGKVDVGWNYSRIRFIRGMWETHSQALAHRLGKPLPPSAVKITTEPHEDGSQTSGREKITAVVNVPQSTKFRYVALRPPIIDTPQLRDMGEATPPLEWIGLHRDKLPNVTHSIIIVTLLEVAREVEDAYTRILGTG